MLIEQAKPLFSIARATHREVVINGAAVFKDEGKAPLDAEAGIALYARSLLKPWQFLVTDAFAEQSYWAIGLASHSGEAQHLRVMNELCKAEGVTQADLRCPHSYPMNALAAARLLVDQRPKERIFNACSGKHLVFLSACKKRGFDNDYLGLEHPLQTKVVNYIEEALHLKPDWAVDGCGLLTPCLAIGAQMQLWEALALDSSKRAELLKKLWVENPNLVGGEGRLDTELVRIAKGGLLAKEGADGLLMVQSLPHGKAGIQSCFVKLNSGYNAAYLGIALYAKLKTNLKKLNEPMRTAFDYLEMKKEDWVAGDQLLDLSVSRT